MRLEKLQYQQDAINAALAAIDGANVRASDNACANPTLENTRHIDVKMETGTGKTYVYARLMHELRREFGFFKFILLVPSIPIKEGAKMSIQSGEWNRHFRQEFGNQSINLGVVNAGDFDARKGKRKQMPESIRSFCEESRAARNAIHALLLNDAMLASKSMTADYYDMALFGGITCPLEALRATRPFVIIDEPHRFNKENKAWKNIKEGLQPQLIFRFGATFPDRVTGNGRAKKVEKDYENLVYDLNSVRAFNESLVKGVKIEFPEIPGASSGKDNFVKYKIKTIERKAGVTFSRVGSGREITLQIGEDLSVIDPQFGGGITLENISSSTSAMLSNELELHPGMELLPQVFGMGYQELLLRQAIDEHFAIERKNFHRASGGGANLPRIKTNSLFFIDSVASFRGGQGDAGKGWLRGKFEELLAEKLHREIKEVTGDYRTFLEASLRDIDKTIAGYFAEDNAKKGDEAIQAEVDDILRNREEMLCFKRENGDWNTRRFLFSKWTLREGWDNPNVFVICKLRTSGSEISKIQEVGRGLRLPFDENGSRMSAQNSSEDFRLSYIIDFSEREFARKLIGEINADGAKIDQGKINSIILEELVRTGYAPAIAKAKGRLLTEDIIDEQDMILNLEKLLALLPEDNQRKLKSGAVTGRGLPERPMLKLNRENFAKLKTLWDEVTRRYVLKFEEVPGDELKAALKKIFSNEALFIKPQAAIDSQILKKGEAGEMLTLIVKKEIPRETDIGILPYGEFLKRLNKRTSLPVALLHKCIARTRRGMNVPPGLFNVQTLENIIKAFEETFAELFAQKFSYARLDFHAQTSIFAEDGGFVEELKQGLVGEKIATGIDMDMRRYLYDKIAYDSDIEHEVLKQAPPPRVVVYGKLPRRSIQLPTYTGGTTSPDFVYAIRKEKTDAVELHLIVEIKSDNPRLSDEKAVDAQRRFFKGISPAINWEMKTDADAFARLLKELAS